jgi:hypothetical protein
MVPGCFRWNKFAHKGERTLKNLTAKANTQAQGRIPARFPGLPRRKGQKRKIDTLVWKIGNTVTSVDSQRLSR